MNISIFPRTTEKAYAQSQKNVYVFDAPETATKKQIIDAVESQYGVKTIGIKTLVQTGKAIRFSKGKRAHPGTTFRKNAKKAYVTLAKGDSIKVFDEVATAEKTSAKAEKKEKK